MALVLNGSNDTITGLQINSANIVDGSIVNADINASAAIASTKLSGVSAGITEADSWYLTSSFTGDATPIANNLARCNLSNDGFNKLGTGMSVSSGIWTFPSTGFWLVHGDLFYEAPSGYSSRYNEFGIFATDNNSTYVEVARSGSYYDNYEPGSDRINSATSQAIIDCTDTSNVKIQFKMQVHNNSIVTVGSSSIYKTRFNFIRLADT